MFKLRIERAQAPIWFRLLTPVIAVVITILITSLLFIMSGVDPLEAYYYFLIVPFTSTTGIIEILLKSTPLIMTGLAMVFCFSAGYFNIGAEGQLYGGAIAAAWLGFVLKGVSPYVGIPLMILGGFVGGMLWALIPVLLKIKLSVDEVVTTVLLNVVMANIISWLLNGPWRDPVSGWPQSPEIDPGTVFIKIFPDYRLNLGFIIAILLVLIVWLLLSKTVYGLKLRIAGLGQQTAAFAGINIKRTILVAALVSGGIAGIAGAGEVAGNQMRLVASLSTNYGYSGIIVATLGALNPFGATASALLLGLINIGAINVTSYLGVPVFMGEVAQATLLLVTLVMLKMQNYRIRRS